MTALRLETSSPDAAPPVAKRRNGLWWVVIASLVLAILVIIAWYGAIDRESARVQGKAEPGLPHDLPAHSVAVLPFESLGPGSQDDEHLASGLTEGVLLHALANDPRIDRPSTPLVLRPQRGRTAMSGTSGAA